MIQQNLNKPTLRNMQTMFLTLMLVLVSITILASCTPGSGSAMSLPDTSVKGNPDLGVKDAPVFSPSTINQEFPLQLAQDKKTSSGEEIIFDGCVETSYDPAYVFAWYESELTKTGWNIIYSRKYDEKYSEGKLTAVRDSSRLGITIIKSTNETKTVITYLCTKETK
jgi:hypothetical protein